MSEENDLLVRMRSNMGDFSKGHRAIARFILANYDKASYMTAAVLGKNAGVSESTVVRFANAMGYDGFPEFSSALADYVSSKLSNRKRLEIATDEMDSEEILDFVMGNDIENIKMTWKNIDRFAIKQAAETILKARNVYIVGIRGSYPIASMLHYDLNLVRNNVFLVGDNGVSDIFEQLFRVGSKDVVIGISFPRYSIKTIKAMEFANDRNARVISITDSKHSPLNLYSSCNLFAESSMSSVVDSFAAPISLINALMVTLCMKNKSDVIDNIEALENIWNDYNSDSFDEVDLLNEDKIKDFEIKDSNMVE